MVKHAWNLSTWEAVAGRSIQGHPQVQRVLEAPGPARIPVSEKQNKRKMKLDLYNINKFQCRMN